MTMPEYQIGDYRFEARSFLPIDLFDAITDQRVRNPTVAFVQEHKNVEVTLTELAAALPLIHVAQRIAQ